jgi:hypothetical protein
VVVIWVAVGQPNVDVDDLAARMPEKLAQMKTLFLI